MKSKRSLLVTGLFLEAIALCLILSFSVINIAATATLLIFNVLFLSLIIQLNITVDRKLGILAAGNISGLLWNIALHHFAIAGSTFFGETFNVFYAISYPFLNFMWVVFFWSLSARAKPKITQAEVKP
jgi:hypothetical protein